MTQEIESQNTQNPKPANKKTPFTKDEKKGVLLLLTLYTIQGFPIGFFGQAIQLLLTEAGISMTQLAELAVVFYPFTFKFLFAPFQDAHYFKSFGKRKSYIVPIQYLMTILFFAISFQIESLLQQQEISKLIIYGFIGIFLSAQQDIAVDGLVLTVFENDEHANVGSTCNNIGQLLGSLITGPIFIQLNSVTFCNKFIFSKPQDQPLVSASQFLLIIAVIIGVVTAFVHFFVKERESSAITEEMDKKKKIKQDEGEEEELQNFIDVVKKLKGFITNINLRFLVIVLLTCNVGISPVYASFGVLLVKQGFSKELLSTISTIVIPFNFIAAITASKFIRLNQEMYTWRNSLLYLILLSFIGYIIIILNPVIDDFNRSTLFFVVLLYQIITTFIQSFKFISQGGFFNRISDEDVGGSSLTTLNSVTNLGGQFSEQISLVAMSHFSFTTVVFSGYALAVTYILLLSKRIISLQSIPKQQWKLEKVAKKKI